MRSRSWPTIRSSAAAWRASCASWRFCAAPLATSPFTASTLFGISFDCCAFGTSAKSVIATERRYFRSFLARRRARLVPAESVGAVPIGWQQPATDSSWPFCQGDLGLRPAPRLHTRSPSRHALFQLANDRLLHFLFIFRRHKRRSDRFRHPGDESRFRRAADRPVDRREQNIGAIARIEAIGANVEREEIGAGAGQGLIVAQEVASINRRDVEIERRRNARLVPDNAIARPRKPVIDRQG